MSTLAIIGVLQNGERRAPLVPANPRQALRLIRGETSTVRIAVVTPAGTPVDLSGGTLTLTVKPHSDDTEVSFQVAATLSNAVAGLASFAVSSTAFQYVSPGRYVYDVWLTAAGGARSALVPLSPLALEPSVPTL